MDLIIFKKIPELIKKIKYDIKKLKPVWPGRRARRRGVAEWLKGEESGGRPAEPNPVRAVAAGCGRTTRNANGSAGRCVKTYSFRGGAAWWALLKTTGNGFSFLADAVRWIFCLMHRMAFTETRKYGHWYGGKAGFTGNRECY